MSTDYSTWPFTRLELPASCNRALRLLGVHTLADLAGFTEAELLCRHQIGLKRLALIKSRMAAAGMNLTPGLPTGKGKCCNDL